MRNDVSHSGAGRAQGGVLPGRSLERGCADLEKQLASALAGPAEDPEAAAGLASLQTGLARAQQALQVHDGDRSCFLCRADGFEEA